MRQCNVNREISLEPRKIWSSTEAGNHNVRLENQVGFPLFIRQFYVSARAVLHISTGSIAYVTDNERTSTGTGGAGQPGISSTSVTLTNTNEEQGVLLNNPYQASHIHQIRQTQIQLTSPPPNSATVAPTRLDDDRTGRQPNVQNPTSFK